MIEWNSLYNRLSVLPSKSVTHKEYKNKLKKIYILPNPLSPHYVIPQYVMPHYKTFHRLDSSKTLQGFKKK